MYIILFYCVYISHAIRLTFLKKSGFRLCLREDVPSSA